MAGTDKYAVVQVYVLLSCVLKLDDQTLVHLISQITLTLLLRAPAETVECVSRTVEDGGHEHFWSGCGAKPVSVDQMHSTHHAAQIP